MTKYSKKKYLFLLCLWTIIFGGVYVFFTTTDVVQFHIEYVYAGLAVGLILFYVIYNKGFVWKGCSPRDLHWNGTIEEKEEYLNKCYENAEKSKWILTLFIPLLLVFAVDMIILFVIPYFQGLFS